jgi:hypothetical protein
LVLSRQWKIGHRTYGVVEEKLNFLFLGSILKEI